MTTNREQLAEVLESPQCFCGNVKKMRHAFCNRCFFRLPTAAQTFVKYIRNDTFHGTYNAALDLLEKQNANQSRA